MLFRSGGEIEDGLDMGADDEQSMSAGARDNEIARESLRNLGTAMQVGTLTGKKHLL